VGSQVEHHRRVRKQLEPAGGAMSGLILWPRLGIADTAEEAIDCALIAEALALAPSYRLL
jgi:hypothetical protein